jgi:hypothetical protein
MPSTIYIQTLIAMLLTGCATGRTVQSVNLESIEIARDERPGCQGVDGFSLDSKSRDGLVDLLRNRAFRSGANFVKVTMLRVGEATGQVRASGILMICPVVKQQARPKNAGLMPEINEATRKAKGRKDKTTPGGLPASPSLSVPEAEDGNPFE